MHFDWWTLGLELINFLVLVWILQRFLYRPVLSIIARRQEDVEAAFTEAVEAKTTAEQTQRSFEGQQAQLADERQAVLKEAHAAALEERERVLGAARAEADKIARAARKKLAEERGIALADVAEKAVDLAGEMSRSILRQARGSAVAEAMLERVEATLSDLPEDKLAPLRHQVAEGSPLRVVTAPSLDRAAQRRWRARLGQRLGNDADIRFEVDDKLIAGAELHFATAALRFAWTDMLAEAQKSLLDDIVAKG